MPVKYFRRGSPGQARPAQRRRWGSRRRPRCIRCDCPLKSGPQCTRTDRSLLLAIIGHVFTSVSHVLLNSALSSWMWDYSHACFHTTCNHNNHTSRGLGFLLFVYTQILSEPHTKMNTLKNDTRKSSINTGASTKSACLLYEGGSKVRQKHNILNFVLTIPYVART